MTHQRLLEMAREKGLFYVHDSILGDKSIDSREHRLLLAEAAKRSRYFIVNPALIDRPCVRGGQNEIGNRYFEGAAAGTIMIGERPANEAFAELFDWPDAVLDLPYNSGDIDKVIFDLDKRPEDQERMRCANVANALMRHDWAYRWEEVLRAAGLAPLPALLERKARLREMARKVSASAHGNSIECCR